MTDRFRYRLLFYKTGLIYQSHGLVIPMEICGLCLRCQVMLPLLHNFPAPLNYYLILETLHAVHDIRCSLQNLVSPGPFVSATLRHLSQVTDHLLPQASVTVISIWSQMPDWKYFLLRNRIRKLERCVCLSGFPFHQWLLTGISIHVKVLWGFSCDLQESLVFMALLNQATLGFDIFTYSIKACY